MATNTSPIPYEFHLLCVLLFVGVLGGCSSSFNMLVCVHSWIEQSSHPVSSLNQFFFEQARTCVPDELDLSLCTVGTSSAFLQTADNICLLTCTVTCRTLLTLQIFLPPRPAWPALLWSVLPRRAPWNSGAQTRSLHLRLPVVNASWNYISYYAV